MNDFKFPKSERLTNKAKFEALFESGKVIKAFPLKFIYLTEAPTENTPPAQVAFTVPKRSFKKAIDRNFLKRRMREAYRLNKPNFLANIDHEKEHLFGILIYTNREKMDFLTIEKAWKKIINKWSIDHQSI